MASRRALVQKIMFLKSIPSAENGYWNIILFVPDAPKMASQ